MVAICFLLFMSWSGNAAPVQGGRPATPAFWTVEQDGKTLYLLGSVHLLPPELKWSRAEIDEAILRSQVFVFEAPVTDADASMARFVEANGKLPKGKTLKDVLTPAMFAELGKAAWAVQYPPKLLYPLRPWLAAVYLELYSYLQAGFSPFYGVDQVLDRRARERGATLEYFESVDEQLSYFLKLSGKAEIDYLSSTVHGLLVEPELPAELIGAWAAGDTAKLSALIDQGFKDTPQLRAQLLVARNRAWVPRIVKMLKSGKVHFVTVGVGHLVGADSVVALLRGEGVTVRGP
jgi:uncharacterized protein YbaP (TraB family)